MRLRDAEHELHLKETRVATLEAETRDVRRGVAAEEERELVEDVAALNRDLLGLCAVTGASELNQRLETRSPTPVSSASPTPVSALPQ